MDAVFVALGAPRRREILRHLRRREHSAGEIHRALGEVTFGAVSQHLAVLERAGLVRARREGRRRFYAARLEGLEPLRHWLESMWDDALASLKLAAEAEEARLAMGTTPRARVGAEERRRPGRLRKRGRK